MQISGGRVDLNSAQNYLTKLQQLTDALPGQVSAFGDAGAKAVAQWTAYCQEQTQKLAQLKAEEALQAITSQLDRTKHWLEGFIKDSKVYDCERYLTQLTNGIKDKEGELSGSEAGRAYLASIKAYVDDATKQVANIKALEALQGITSNLDRTKNWLDGYIKDSKVSDAERYFTQLTNTLKDKEKDLSGCEAGQTYLTNLQAYIEETSKKINQLKAEEALQGITSQLDRTKYWLDGYIKECKVSDSERYWTQLNNALKEKEELLSGSEAGRAYLEKTKAYLEDCQKLMRANELKDKAQSILYSAESQMRWMNDYKNRGETDRAGEYWKKVQDLMAPILAESAYFELQNVKDFMVKYKETEASFGGDIAVIQRRQEREAAENQIKSKGRWLTGALNDKHLDNSVKYSEEFKPMFDAYQNEFGGEPEAKETILFGRDLLERVENEMTPMVNKREADAILSPGNFNVRWLCNALNSKEEHRAIEYRDKLQPNIDALKDPKYKYIPEVVTFLKEAEDAMFRMEAELGDIISGREIQQYGEQARSQLRYLESYLNAKDTDAIQQYTEKVQAIQAPLQRYQRYPAAQDWLIQIEVMLRRVDDEMGAIIAENKIKAISQDLDWPLRNLERAIQNKEVAGIIQGKERVLALSSALVPFSTYSAAKPTLDRVNELLAQCDGEAAGIIVDSKVTELQAAWKPLMDIVQQSASSGNKKGIEGTSLKLATLVYPLRVQYPKFPKVQDLCKQVDDIVSTHGVRMNEYQKQKFDSLKASLSSQVASLSTLSGNQLVNALKEVNKQVQLIRKQSLNDPEVLAYLLDIDQVNLKVFGRVPSEDEYLPIVEVDIKSPFNVQNAVKACNKACEEINKALLDCKNTFGAVDLTGVTCKYDSSKFLNIWDQESGYRQPTLQMNVEAAERAIKAFDEKEVAALKALDPSCPALGMYPDAIDQTRKTIQKWKVDWPAAILYSIANGNANAWLRNLKKLIAELSTVKHEGSRNFRCDSHQLFGHDYYRDFWVGKEQTSLTEVFSAGLATADRGLKQVNEVCKTMREDHPEANLLGAQIEKAKKEIHTIGVALFETLIKRELEEGHKEFDYEYENHEALKFAESYIGAIKVLEPQHPELDNWNKKLAETRQWVADAKKRKEEAERLKREEIAQANAGGRQVLLQKWKTPFSGGRITTPDSTWDYAGDGAVKCIQGYFSGWTANWNESDRNRISLDLFFKAPNEHEMPNNYCWLLWESGAMECDFHTINISNNIRCHDVINLPAPGPDGYFSQLFEIKATRTEGSVPPPITAALSGLKYGLGRCQAQMKVDKLALRKVKWKEQRFEQLSRAWPSSCRNCNTGGSNQYFCFDCEASYCTDSRCKPSGSGSNVCPFCNSYSGGYRPSWASALKDPKDVYDWERKLNEFILTEYDYPRWARWLEDLRL